MQPLNGSTAARWSGDDQTPPVLPDLDLIRPIGKGGFGEVWLATNRTTGLLRAVKVISLNRSGRVDRASREITSIIRLEANVHSQHPNLLDIHHVGKTADHLFYIMEPADDVSGSQASADPSYQPATLESRIKSGPLSPAECLRYTQELLAGLSCIHQANMVHRDIKPTNCLFVGGQLKLADFGLLTEADRQISLVGTLRYMPPDGCMDTRADVYAVGLVIYEMITGLSTDDVPRLGEKALDVAGDPSLIALNRLVLRACDRNPQERFSDAQAMLDALVIPEPQTRSQWIRFPRRIVVSVATALLVLILAVGLWLNRPQQVNVNFITEPYEAEIYLDGMPLLKPDGTPYTTPCTVQDLPPRIRHLVFKREGSVDLDVGRIDFANSREIVVHWNTKPKR